MAISITIAVGDSVAVSVEDDSGFNPDVLEMLATTARDLFRQAVSDLGHAQTEHPPVT